MAAVHNLRGRIPRKRIYSSLRSLASHSQGFQCVAQLGSALPSDGRGRRFESCHADCTVTPPNGCEA